MNTVERIRNQKGKWLFVVPICGLRFFKGVTQEFQINRIIIVSRKRLVFVRKRLGFNESISDLKKKFPHDSMFDNEDNFAIYVAGGSGAKQEKDFLKTVREELKILSLSQLGWSRRKSNANLSVSNEKKPGNLQYLMHNLTADRSIMSRKTVGKFRTLDITKRWKEYQRKDSYFYRLLDIYRGKHALSPSWRKDIVNAALLAGESQSSTDLAHAFLWNMIAIETLLTHQGDVYSNSLPKRVEAFIGWTGNWQREEYENNIRKIYKKRCEFVHSGRFENLEIRDLLFTDTILLNIFYNILRHINRFGSKDDLVDFSMKIEAERILGLPVKVRPKTITFIDPVYDKKDYEVM